MWGTTDKFSARRSVGLFFFFGHWNLPFPVSPLVSTISTTKHIPCHILYNCQYGYPQNCRLVVLRHPLLWGYHQKHENLQPEWTWKCSAAAQGYLWILYRYIPYFWLNMSLHTNPSHFFVIDTSPTTSHHLHIMPHHLHIMSHHLPMLSPSYSSIFSLYHHQWNEMSHNYIVSPLYIRNII